MKRGRPHVLGIDDAPFDKHQPEPVPIVGVMMEGAVLVESVAITRFPVDGDHATRFLADWVGGLRCRPSLQAICLGGVTLAGLGIVDLEALAALTGLPVLAFTRRDTLGHRVAQALRAAGLHERIALVERSPAARPLAPGIHLASAGAPPAEAAALARACLGKSRFPEALRVAHLIGAALVNGESRGRV